MYNGTLWSHVGGGNFPGAPSIIFLLGTNNTTIGNVQWRWENNAAFQYDAIIVWGDTGFAVEGKAMGFLWDAVCSSDIYAADTASTFDSHNWTVLTAAGTNGGNYTRGTLLIATS
jgi:hypothetical protein